MFAQILMSEGVDLSINWFAQPDRVRQIVYKWCKTFGFHSSNPCRPDYMQFYYSAQTGRNYINKQK